MRIVYAIAVILLVIGGLAWGVVGLFDVNILEMFGADNPLTLLIYLLLAVAAVIVAAVSVRTLAAGTDDKTRPDAAQPPEGQRHERGADRSSRTGAGSTPHRPERGAEDPKKPGSTGATGAGPGGTA